MARNPSAIVLSLGGQGWIRGKRFIGKVTCGLVYDAGQITTPHSPYFARSFGFDHCNGYHLLIFTVRPARVRIWHTSVEIA